MSDKNSESSEEWIVLNENEDLSLDNHEEQPLNLQLSYDAVCDAVSESISSFSSEELEWQYEQFPDFIPQYGSSCIEELDYHQFDTESKEILDVINAEDNDTSNCLSDFDDDKTIDTVFVKKIQCYKHNRNDRLNFVLNLSVALVLASAIGLGIGHFLGWSHKCYKSTLKHSEAYSSDVLDAVVYTSKQSDILTTTENVEESMKESNILDAAPFSDNLSDISCWNPKDGEKSALQEVCISHTNIDIVTLAILPETPILLSEDVLELKTEEINQNNISDSIFSVSSIIADDKWHQIARPLKDLNELLEHMEVSPQEIASTDAEKFDTADYISSFDMNDDVAYKYAKSNQNFKAFKSLFENETPKESNLINQLRQDLSHIIQSLRAIAVARLTQVNDNYPMLVKNFEGIIKYYIEFEGIVNLKLTEIDDFILSSEYKMYEKTSLKHLQKMIYCLIDSVDYLMKVSIKTLNRGYERINIQKFSNNISKVIFNFNRRWEKNNRIWSQSVAKVKFQEIKKNFFKKENRYYKQKSQFEKEVRNNKYKRYSMKS